MARSIPARCQNALPLGSPNAIPPRAILDVGVDVALDDATDFAGIGRANLGVAAVLGKHQLGVEGTFQAFVGDGFAEYSHTVGLSYRLQTSVFRGLQAKRRRVHR